MLASQLDYYKQRASEYDEWWSRKGRYDQGEEHTKMWFGEIESAEQIMRPFLRSDDVALEIACGTGNWTRFLVQDVKIAKLRAVDGNSEPIEVLKAKFQIYGIHDLLEKVQFQVADAFQTFWSSDEYSLVFMGFFLSHVPPSEMKSFLARIYDTLKDNGRVVFIDSYYLESHRANIGNIRTKIGYEAVDYAENQHDDVFLIKRKLNDNSTHTIVKVCYEPEVVQNLFAKHGFKGEAYLTPNKKFIIGNFTKTNYL